MKTTAAQQPTRSEAAESPKPATRFITPEVNIFETLEGWILEAEMPGVNKDGLEVLLEANELTILGHRPADTGGLTPLFTESCNADYRRVFELDPAIDSARIEARMEQGVLRLQLPKAERVKPKKIEVTG